MNAALPALRPCRAADLDALCALLADAGLPHADVAEHMNNFVVADHDGQLAGAGGYQDCGGGYALLRSFVVRPEQRGQGLGRRLYRRIEAQARRAALTELYLLTTSAGDWFTALGFSACPRDKAPAPIRATRQFAELCPASATLLRRSLTPAADSPATPAPRELEGKD